MNTNAKLDEILKDVFEPLPELQMEATRMRVLRRLRAEQPDLEMPASESVKRAIPSVHRLWRAMAVAASVLLAAATGMVFTGLFLDSASAMGTAGSGLYRVVGHDVRSVREGAPIQRGDILRTLDTANGIATLADGSRLEMRASTELSVQRAADGVSIHLAKGDVIVNAAKQRQGQLHVQTQDVTVSVDGTVFFVKAEPKGSQVAVIEGAVHVQQGATEKKLLRGEQVSSNPELEPRPLQDEIAWSQNVASHLALLQVPVYTLEEIKPGMVIGIVRISNGSPAAGIRVTATRADSADSTLRPVANIATTDDSGRFRIENLSPGNYYVAAGRSDLPTFYPGTLEIAKGTIVSVRSGAIVSAINFAVREVSIPLTTSPVMGLELVHGVGTYFSSHVAVGAVTPQTGANPVNNPDLIGEIKLILAPVDGEPGRGNGQIQIQTSSGENRFTGRAVWNVQPSSPDSKSPSLTCFSVFGATRLDANGNMVPFTQADCPNGTAVVPTTPSTAEAPTGNSNDASSTRVNRWATGITYAVTGSNWWNNERVIRELQLTDDQRQKIDIARQPCSQPFAKNSADITREEGVLKRMVAPGSNESNLVPQQEERVLQLRRTQEDANSKLNQELTLILTDAQRTQLQPLLESLRSDDGRRRIQIFTIDK